MVERRDSSLAAPLLSHITAASLHLPPLKAARAAWARSEAVVYAPRPQLRGIKAVVQCFPCSAVPAAAPPTSPFMALLIDLLAARAQALSPRCSSVCGRVVLLLPVLLHSVPLTKNSSHEIVHYSWFPPAVGAV